MVISVDISDMFRLFVCTLGKPPADCKLVLVTVWQLHAALSQMYLRNWQLHAELSQLYLWNLQLHSELSKLYL